MQLLKIEVISNVVRSKLVNSVNSKLLCLSKKYLFFKNVNYFVNT